ncbi:hypothetical protein ABT235_25745 [Micromonospora echinofusca]|uniref:hypothetical protein n=1 Tax=Micromonospora echinofusca TaxID=47858 RepID=UPI003333B420
MTKRRVTVSVPEDVAETLEQQPNASAYVAQAVRDRRRMDEFRALTADAGVQLTEQGMAEARARRLQVQAQWPRERYEAVRDRVRQHMQDEADDAGRPAA